MLYLVFRFLTVDHQTIEWGKNVGQLLTFSHRFWPLQMQITLAFKAINSAMIFKKLFNTLLFTVSVSP